MKHIDKIALIVMMLSGISALAQVNMINFNPYSPIFTPQVKYDDNKLILTHPAGIFYQDYSTGELPEDWGSDRHQWEMFAFGGHAVNDFFISGDKIIALTDNIYPDGHLFIRSTDGGKSFEEFTPKSFPLFMSQFDGTPITYFIQNPKNKDELLLYWGMMAVRTTDFGETWEFASIPGDIGNVVSAKYHPSDSNIIISGGHSWFDYYPSGSFSITTDGGSTWNKIDYSEREFELAKTIIFHPTNKDLILLGSLPIIKSTDCGETWETVCTTDESNCNLYRKKWEFDVRGSNRLYACDDNNIYYSDDFGATWAELCEIGLSGDGNIADFVQRDSKIYIYSQKYYLFEVNLELLESAIEEVPADASNVAISIANGTLQVLSQSQISTIEVFNIGGVKMLSTENVGNVDISDLAKGTYVARVSTSNGKTVSRKFNK